MYILVSEPNLRPNLKILQNIGCKSIRLLPFLDGPISYLVLHLYVYTYVSSFVYVFTAGIFRSTNYS